MGQVQHHRAVLADRIEHHRIFGLGDDLAQNLDALGFEALQVSKGHGFWMQRLRDAARVRQQPRR